MLRVSLLLNASKDTTEAIYKAVETSNVSPIVASFDIKAYSKDKKGCVIDVTNFFKTDNEVVSIPSMEKRNMKLGALAADRSFIQRIKTFPINTEITTVKTYNFQGGTPTAGSGPGRQPIPAGLLTGAVTFEMNISFLLLPKVPMQKRFYDKRVGYFYDSNTAYNDNSEGVKTRDYIVRWRLQPKPEDMEKYKRGELVEPEKPIVYYINPATPKKWVPYLIAGITDWQKAFEQAGFKNAILAKPWPVGDTNMSMEDARYSVLRYFASPVSNAYGPNVHDPRTGEILESHIGWYHNVMKLVHDWYMVQAGAIDPRARKMEFDDSLMGQLIRFVSSHEIGHTLGLRHNFGSSSTVPVEKLRDKKWLDAHGHTPSIMDYARFNYVAQPEDHIDEKGIFPRIGDYDKWAIEWGYKLYPNITSAEAEQKMLLKSTTARLKRNPRLWFGHEPNFFSTEPVDPRSQSEDLGDDPVKASNYGIMNLQRVMKGLPEWTKEDDDFQDNLKRMWNAVLTEYRMFMGHVANYIGSRYINNKTDMEAGPVFVPVSRERQKEAVAHYTKQVFQTPKWLVPPVMVNRIGIEPIDEIKKIDETAILNCTNSRILYNIVSISQFSSDPYTLPEYMKDLEEGIWGELETHRTIDIYRRNLQKIYIDNLSAIVKPPAPGAGSRSVASRKSPAEQSDVVSYIRMDLIYLKERIQEALPFMRDQMTRYHLMDILSRIDKATRDKEDA